MKTRAVLLTKYDNNILRALFSVSVDEIEIKKLQADEVLIKMEAAPCNPSDIAFLRGGYNIVKPLPAVPGFEGTGMVVETGIEAKGMIGKRVSCFIAEEGAGTWSEYFCTKARNCIVMKPEMKTGQAACFSINPLTAFGMFELVKKKQAQAFIQNAAGGQVPGFLRDFARKKGIHVINLVRKSDHIALLQKHGR
jgi:NADPH:quinone reductase